VSRVPGEPVNAPAGLASGSGAALQPTATKQPPPVSAADYTPAENARKGTAVRMHQHEELRRRAAELTRQGQSITQIAEEMGRSLSAVSVWRREARELGLLPPRR
jgi:DNA-binding NarL/FixJ family response regulator